MYTHMLSPGLLVGHRHELLGEQLLIAGVHLLLYLEVMLMYCVMLC